MKKLSPIDDPEDTHNKGFRPYVETESSAQDVSEMVTMESDQPHENFVELGQNRPNNSAPHAHEVQAAQDVIDFEEIEPVQPPRRNLIQGRLTIFRFTTTGNQLPFHVICRECGLKLKNKKSKLNERGRRCHHRYLDRLRRP